MTVIYYYYFCFRCTWRVSSAAISLSIHTFISRECNSCRLPTGESGVDREFNYSRAPACLLINPRAIEITLHFVVNQKVRLPWKWSSDCWKSIPHDREREQDDSLAAPAHILRPPLKSRFEMHHYSFPFSSCFLRNFPLAKYQMGIRLSITNCTNFGLDTEYIRFSS
jgi:hypothetical protein